MYVSGLPFDGDTIPSGQSLGGSETAAVQLAEELGRQGHRVTVFCNCEGVKEIGGVLYSPIGWAGRQFPKGFYDYIRSVPVDVCIVQRIPSMFQFETRSKVNLLWQHDLATKTGPSIFQPYCWNIDRILVLSQFMKKQYQEVHGGSDDLYHVTRNGVDPELLASVPETPRDRFRLTYTARPERGLDILLRGVFPKILEREPRAKLYVSRYTDPNTMEFYGQLEAEMKRFGDRVEFLGNLGKKALYDNYRRSRLYLYPSMFEEVSCITAMEVAASGCVFLGPWRAALPETLGGCAPLLTDEGVLGRPGDAAETGLKPPSEKFVAAVADHAVRLMRDDAYWEDWQRKSLVRAQGLSWKGVAEDWMQLVHETIARKSGDARRMVRHFLFNSDVVAARKYADEAKSPQLQRSVDNYVDRYVPFMSRRIPEEKRPTIQQFYEQRSGGDRANWQTAMYAETEVRTQQLINFIRPHVESGDIKTLLDFGCAHGGYTKALTDAFPNLKVVGVDTSPSLVRCANELKASGQCKNPQNMRFVVADENTSIPKLNDLEFGDDGIETYQKPFDCVVAMEVLEHLPDAEAAATKLEGLCREGGWTIFTVPSGHRERDELVSKGVPPVHVRSFDLHDLRDLFQRKPEYSVTSFSDLTEAEMDRTFSCWFMVCYRADHAPLGEIDYGRKFFLQGPRETLAVCVIAHNSEDVMHRCLRSVIRYADQVIVVDNGPSTDRTAEVAMEYTEDVRAGTSPFWCYTHLVVHPYDGIDPNVCEMAGFETPRNESVEGVWTDWIMWIDCDEQLLDPANLPKYLRSNCYVGYAVEQHHISVDAVSAMKRDVPVRLYRNVPEMRFYGIVHEHAELGINRGVGPNVMVATDVKLHHDGYLVESIRRNRFRRNLRLLQCDRRKYPERLLGWFLYEIRDCQHMARYEQEQNGGFVNEKVQQLCHTTIRAYREKFMKDNMMMSEDALNYYSNALAMLGMGVDVVADIEIGRQGSPMGPQKSVMRFRAADVNEAAEMLKTRMGQLAVPHSGRYVA
jgi:glycosyltransferase involved in cell wall biosynthesis/SAM-dependent methyltransferase